MNGEGVQLVAQSGPDGPALVGVDGGGDVNGVVLRGAAVVVEGARQGRHRERVGQGETQGRSEGLGHVHGRAGLGRFLGLVGLGAI